MKKSEIDLIQIEQTLRSHPFVAPWFLQNAHIQTSLALLAPYFKVLKQKPERKYIAIPDGTTLIAECWWQKDKEKHATIVLTKGFGGFDEKDSSRFIESMYAKAYHSNFNVIYLSQRGEGDSIHLTKSIFTTYGGFDDIKIALRTFKDWGLQKIYIVGLSHGGYLLFHTIDRLGTSAEKYLAGGVAIATHVGMFNTWKHIEKNKIYDNWLFRNYKETVKRRIKVDPQGTWDSKKLQTIKSKREFMETYLHTFGYPKKNATLDEYDKDSDVSTTNFFSKINIPLLIINAYDDPIAPIEPYLTPQVQNNPNIITLLTKYGGHGGFFTTEKLYGDIDGHWAQNRAMEFIKLLDRHSGLSRIANVNS